MRKPRRIKSSFEDWFEGNRHELMQRYVKDRSGLLWMAWVKAEYEVYRGQ